MKKKRLEILRVGDDDRIIRKRKDLENKFKFIVIAKYIEARLFFLNAKLFNQF